MLGVTDYGTFVITIIVFLAIPGPGNLALVTSTSKGGIAGGLAATLGAAEKTIKVHRARVMAKMAVRSLTALVRMVDRVRQAALELAAKGLNQAAAATR